MNTSTKYQEVVLHFVFTTKYRLPLLAGLTIPTRLEAIIREVCAEFHTEILALAIQPEHVHLLIALPRNLTRPFIARMIKGRSSRLLRQDFPSLVILCPKALWGSDYFVRSVGGGKKRVAQYIKDQGL